MNPVHDLFAFGSDDGRVAFWDPRSRNALGDLNIQAHVPTTYGARRNAMEITAFHYQLDGLTYAVGTSTGQVLLYDLRQTTPFLIKDHQYGFPIKSIDVHRATNQVISADTKVIKLWDRHHVRHHRHLHFDKPIHTGHIMVVGPSHDIY